MTKGCKRLPWLEPGGDFPPIEMAWGADDDAPGLLAAGGALDVATLTAAYSQGIFPWFSDGQPILWWSPEPRMVLQTAHFKLHRSLRKSLVRFSQMASCELRIDTAFRQVIESCSSAPRAGQGGTWIVPEMVEAYVALHDAGHAHSIETWVDGELAGGLYCVNLGGMVFGESMFARKTDASKIALAALVAFCRVNGMGMIDCQQNTRHLASLGASVLGRHDFAAHLQRTTSKPSPAWSFDPIYWQEIINSQAQSST